MAEQNYSVLMSVYKNEKADRLRTAMNSMWQQTLPTDDFVLMCDGPLTPELDAVIAEMQKEYGKLLHVVRFPENRGLGYALKTGIHECKNDIVARMDSDDISRPERCEKEMDIFINDSSISIVGSVIEEFSKIEPGKMIPSAINSQRVVPEKQQEILSFAKKRNPFNHPSVMLKKADVIAAGNYPDIRYMQDYYLWVNMLIAGFKGYNIQQPLVWMRADTNLFKRRSGKLYRNIQLDLFRKMRDENFITNSQYLESCVLRIGSSMAPNWLREFVFKKILRKA